VRHPGIDPGRRLNRRVAPQPGVTSMPSNSTVEALMTQVESGDYVGAIENFYHADASMQENNDPPRVGRDILVAG